MLFLGPVHEASAKRNVACSNVFPVACCIEMSGSIENNQRGQ